MGEDTALQRVLGEGPYGGGYSPTACFRGGPLVGNGAAQRVSETPYEG